MTAEAVAKPNGTSGERGRGPARKMLTAEEVADFLGVSIDTLAQWRSQRRGPPYVKLGRAVRYQMSALERHLAENTIVPLTKHDA